MNSLDFFKSRKFWIITISIIILSFVVWSVVKAVKSVENQNLHVDETHLVITDNQAILIANNLLGAMNQYGTDETTIISNLQDLNKDDLILVIKKFGVKPYVNSGGFLATSWFQKNFSSVELNLIGWLKRELSGSHLETVKQIFINNSIPF